MCRRKWLIKLVAVLVLFNQVESSDCVAAQHSDLNFEYKSKNRLKNRKKKHFLSLCSLFKDEAKFLKEWIEYHLLIGVDHFYLYNLESSDSSKKVLREYVSRGIVTLINWPDFVKNQNNF